MKINKLVESKKIDESFDNGLSSFLETKVVEVDGVIGLDPNEVKASNMPRGCRILSSSLWGGRVYDHGTILWKGNEYVFRVREDGTVKVMTTAQAGSNWSETIFKESVDSDIKKEYLNYCKDLGIDSSKKSSKNRFMNDYAKHLNNHSGIKDLEDKLNQVEDELKEAFEKDGGPFWYFTKHGLGPGMLPKGVNVVDTKEDDNFGTYIALDKVLTTQELKEYELVEKRPEMKEDMSHFEFTSGANPYIAKTKKETDRVKRSYKDSIKFIKSVNGIDYYKVDDEEKDLFSVDESFKPTESGIQSVKVYNPYNYTIQELRIDNDNKTFERGNFTIGKPDKKTKNRQEYEDVVDQLKELGYTEIKSDYRSLRNKTRKGIPTNEEVLHETEYGKDELWSQLNNNEYAYKTLADVVKNGIEKGYTKQAIINLVRREIYSMKDDFGRLPTTREERLELARDFVEDETQGYSYSEDESEVSFMRKGSWSKNESKSIKTFGVKGKKLNEDNELSTEHSIESMAEQIKKFYELGGFEKLPVGRENAVTKDINGPDKNRLAGYFKRQPEFNYEINNEGGIVSHEFISDKYDIEIFDSFVQMYKIPQNESLSESIDINTIADYITDHYDFDDVDDKYACINSIKDSHKDMISEEELEQFIGSHNGKDKIEEGYEFNPNNADISWRPYDNEKGQVMADKWYAKHYPDDEVGIEQLKYITLDDALKDRSILDNCDTQVRDRVYAQLDKYIPLSKESPMYKEVNESSEGFQKEFYNDYVILKNRAGDGYDIYSYDGTPENVKKAYLEDEGYPTLQAAKDEIDKWSKLDEASYGGAFDIADDQYFTREDLDNFAEEVLNHINETFKTQFEVASCYIDNGVLEVGVTNDEYGDYIYSEKIDMRKIKEPWHLKRAYAFEFASQLINDITQSNDGLIEAVVSSSHEFDDDVDDLSYYYDDEVFNDNLENSTYTEIASKSVMDSDGFMTDYTMYMNINTGEYVFVFGDKDVYSPDDGYFDWECETKEEAEEWFNNYNGFDESDDDIDWMNEDVEESPIVHKKNDGSYLVSADGGGYTAFSKDDVCQGHITASNENEAKSKFNSNQFDE